MYLPLPPGGGCRRWVRLLCWQVEAVRTTDKGQAEGGEGGREGRVVGKERERSHGGKTAGGRWFSPGPPPPPPPHAAGVAGGQAGRQAGGRLGRRLFWNGRLLHLPYQSGPSAGVVVAGAQRSVAWGGGCGDRGTGEGVRRPWQQSGGRWGHPAPPPDGPAHADPQTVTLRHTVPRPS